MESYFKTAACVSWKDWALGFIPFLTKEPYVLPKSKVEYSIPENMEPTLIKTTIESAREISDFLGSYYYDSSSEYSLVLSPRLILHLLQTKQMIGLEIRDKTKIIACMFEFYMGMYKDKRVGLHSWLCIHPSWRRKGLTNLIANTMTYNTPTAVDIIWFRNDSLLQNPLPPIYSTRMMERRIRQKLSPFVEKKNYEHCKEEFINLWKKENPTGFVFDTPTTVGTQFTIWGFEKEGRGLWALVQPTHEVKKGKGQHGCEVLHIVSHGFKDWYEKIQTFEILVDALPFDYCECSIEVPHIEALWTLRGICTWSTVFLHPGRPFQRPVLSMVAS